ncbi:MAG: hypothetical protein AB7E29_08545 [Xanthobacter sp.]
MHIIPAGTARYGAALLVAGFSLFSSASLAQNSRPHVVITPGTIQLPVIPQGNYLDPGPGPAVNPNVAIGNDKSMNYAFPPQFGAGYQSGPPGDPTVNGSWNPLPGYGSLPSF